MTYHLGVDLGTTITTAAVHRAGRAGVVALGEHSASMPSVLLWPEVGAPIVGDAAVRRAAAEPGRVADGIRARLTDPTPFLLDGAPFAASALLGVLLRRVVDLAAEREGGAPDGIVLTHPATWGVAEREAFTGVGASLGLGEIALVPAPVAAAVGHTEGRVLAEGATVAVVEVGGGAVEAAVLRHAAGVFTVIGTAVGDGDGPVVDVVRRALTGAGVIASDLDSVLLVGRSGRMGSTAAALGDDLGRPVTTGPEPEHAVAVGAAHLAARTAVAVTSLARMAPVAPVRRPRPVLTDPVTGPISAPIPAPAPARPSGRRTLVTTLAAAAIALGVVGGGAYALVGAATPAVAAAPVVPTPTASSTPTTTVTPEATAVAEPSPVAVARPSVRSENTETRAPRTRETTRRPQTGSGRGTTSHHDTTGTHDDHDSHGTDTHGTDTGSTHGTDGTDTHPAGEDTDSTPSGTQSW
ncbi:Hsp70 family protein [Actinomycetospora aeridis]|uniref:Hsp70 family protein n=1 Tax=Actinomycetospora aeridis TaxID=3129231 RepID=A0ABU8NEH9_9PSEU